MEVEEEPKVKMKARLVDRCDVCEEYYDTDDVILIKCDKGHIYCMEDFEGIRRATMEIEGTLKVRCQIDQCFA